MSILIDKNTRVMVQGITGKSGSLQAKAMLDAGTNIVAGVTPGKGGQEVYGIPFITMWLRPGVPTILTPLSASSHPG